MLTLFHHPLCPHSRFVRHLAYIETLLSKHDWLASDQQSYADLAAAAHLSVAEYLGDILGLKMELPRDGMHESSRGLHFSR